MNKTRKRAIQKHRAKEAKFSLRRTPGDQNGTRLRNASQPPLAQSRPRPAPRRQQGAEAGE